MIFASDFTFIERAIIEVWVWLWFIQRVWSTDKFSSLQWNKIRNFDLKSIITLLILLMLPAQTIFDVIWAYLKYTEGFYMNDQNDIITKPPYVVDGNKRIALWTKEHLLLKTITEYVLACGFAFQTGTLALIQAFWSHLYCEIRGKPFMRSWKFKFYFGWVFASIVIFPLARFLLSSEYILVENVPLLIFSINLLVIFILGIKNGKRLNGLLRSIQQQSSQRGQETILRIRYYIEMNKLLTIGALLIGIGFSFSSIDAIFKINYISRSKFLMDLFLIHANYGSLILWCTMILIIYPQYRQMDSTEIKGQEMNSNNPNSFVINLTTTTTRKTSRPALVRDSSSFARIEQSVSSLLEQQQQQIDIYRHKTSTSISSTATLTSSYVSNSPLTSPLIPPPIYESSIK